MNQRDRSKDIAIAVEEFNCSLDSVLLEECRPRDLIREHVNFNVVSADELANLSCALGWDVQGLADYFTPLDNPSLDEFIETICILGFQYDDATYDRLKKFAPRKGI